MRNRCGLIGESAEGPRASRSADRPAHRPDGSQRPAGGPVIWDVTGVSAYLQIPVSSIYKMTARKAVVCIPHIRIGRTLRFKQADVDRWLALLTTSHTEALSKMRQKVSQVTHANYSQAASR